LAAVEVEGHALQYFGQLNRAPEIQYETVQLIKPLNFRTLLSVFDGNQELTELYNPHYTPSVRKGYVAIPKGSVVRVPLKKTDVLLQVMSNAPERVPTMLSEKETVHQVSSGETLSGIAVMFGVPVRRIMDVNDVDPRRLRPGQKLIIPIAKD
jgi:LysM repeat protein